MTTYALHPGVIATELLRHTPLGKSPALGLLGKILTWPILKDVEHGIQTTLYCSLEKDIEHLSGEYFR